MTRRTHVSIHGDAFHLNGKPSYPGRTWKGHRIEGLLFNSRMVQGILLQGGSPQGYYDPKQLESRLGKQVANSLSHGQPWHNSAFEADGSPRPAYLSRLRPILERADELGMVVILGLFYFGQDARLQDEAAVIRGLDGAVEWLLEQAYGHLLIEVNNECDVPRYEHPILKPDRVHELIVRVRQVSEGKLLVGTSYGGGSLPGESVVRASDFLLLHGNGVSDPHRIGEMVRQTRAVAGYRQMPILFNEDDHFAFDEPVNNMRQAIAEYASWGYFDPGESNYVDGYQCPPVNWGINTERKRGFFRLVREVTGGAPGAEPPAYS